MFIQSHVSAHAELAWLLSCCTPQGWLNRMTQYKDKVRKQNDITESVLGLYSYPVLMAADILLYQTDIVPVGEDQLQHLELTRDICKTFHHKYCKDTEKVFRIPQAMVVDCGSRVMSIQDGKMKMSKSATDDYSRINMLDEPDIIAAKIKKCKTDSMKVIEYDNVDRPECTNLVQIFQVVSGKTKDEVIREISDLNFGQFKTLLTSAIVEHLNPIQRCYKEIIRDEAYLSDVLKEGQIASSMIADETLKKAKSAMGFSLSGGL